MKKLPQKNPPYSSMARCIATQWWSINQTIPTTQTWAYYYSCSWHGGYVIAYDTLKQKQKDDLIKFYGAYDKIHFEWYTYDHAINKQQKWKYKDETIEKYNWRLKNIPFLLFEEDCDWAICETILNIYREGTTPEKSLTYALKVFERYYSEEYKNFIS